MSGEAQTASITAAALCPQAPVLSLHVQRLALKAWLIATDSMALGAAFFAAYWLRFDLQVTTSPTVVPDPFFYPFLAALLIPLLILVFARFKLYDPEGLLGGVSEYSKI